MSFDYLKRGLSAECRTSGARLVLIELCNSADETGYAFPGWEYMENRTRLSRSSISRGLKENYDLGYVKKTKRKTSTGWANGYKILLPNASKGSEEGVRETPSKGGEGVTETPEGVTETLEGVTETPEPIINLSLTSSSSSESAEVVDAWNASGFSKVRKLTEKRKTALKARLKDSDFRENWRNALDHAKRTKFCNGESDSGWVANLDWFLRPDTLTKILEGKYDFLGFTNPTPKKNPFEIPGWQDIASKVMGEDCSGLTSISQIPGDWDSDVRTAIAKNPQFKKTA